MPPKKAAPQKAKGAKSAKPASTPGLLPMDSPQALRKMLRVAGILALTGLVSPISQLTLSPVYGSIPASLYHQRAITITAVGAFMVKSTFKKHIPVNVNHILPILAYWAPVIQFYLFQYSSKLGPQYGPLVTEGTTYLPIIFVSMLSAGRLLDAIDFSGLGPTFAELLPAIFSYMIMSLVAKSAAAFLPNVIGTYDVLTRSGLQLILSSAFAALSPSIITLLAVPAMYHTYSTNPHHWRPSAFALANTTLDAHGFTLLARQESNTGYISVIEGRKEGFRVLRCDHSLLGGEWLVNEERSKHGQTIKESIYGVFVMLEGIQLIESVSPEKDQKSALVIGLGIGTSPKALIENGINTTIVELDPMVHYYATKYFDLPKNHIAAIQDAVTFVDKVSKTAPESYEYIIHDVFTGGAEPPALFTIEFLEGLKTLLRDDGAIAINYAGDLALPSAQLVINSIHLVFPACRIFRETPRAKDAKETDMDFINMVIFCVKNDHGRGKAAVTFREPTPEDIGPSLSRSRFLKPQPQLEVQYIVDKEKLAKPSSVLHRGATEELEKSHMESALSHWGIMRTVLPDVVWETW